MSMYFLDSCAENRAVVWALSVFVRGANLQKKAAGPPQKAFCFLQKSRNQMEKDRQLFGPRQFVYWQSTADGTQSVNEWVCVCTLRWLLTHPIYCSGWLWWITILHVGHVLFSSRYFTRQLLQTGDAQQKCTVTLHRAHTHTEHLSFKVFICREKNLPHIFRFPCLIHEKQTVFLGFLTLEFAFVDLCAALLYLLCSFIFFLSSCTSTNDLKVQTHLANLIFWSTITPCIS